MSEILIVYASIGGNTELACKMLKTKLEQKDHQIKMIRAEKLAVEPELLQTDLIILASPTYGQGEAEKQMKIFLKKLQKLDLKNQNFAVLGLGDTKFYPEYLSESAAILESWVKENQANLITSGLRIGMPPLAYLDKLIPRFSDKIDQFLKTK